MLAQIEKALQACNGDIFAVICRRYLNFKYSHVYPTGLVLGKDKSRKGTPDTFIPIKDYYVFVEITTEEKNVLNKLKRDISHCFAQTDVPKQKIIKVILMFNGVHDTSSHEELKTHLYKYSEDCDLEVIDIRILANQISKNYPSLARRLGVPIDTAQILEVSEFIEDYEKSKFATPLSNKFYNREKELEEALKLLVDKDILLVSGYAGTGKTKLSLELANRFSNDHEDFKLKYIKSNGGLDIWDDLQSFLLPENNYLLVLDDANKLKSNLEQVLNFKRRRYNTGQIKIILTARNYVKREIEILVNEYNHIDLKPFTKNELKTILQSEEFNISDFYVDRIFTISKGNPRLAIMAAIAGINKELEKLNNPSQIMEVYFSSIRETIKSFENSDLLAVAGLLAMFRTIDLENTEQINEINKYFSISTETLDKNLKTLFQIEVADEFEDAYKIADQILGEYIIYLVFIKDKVVPFAKLIEVYIDKDGRFSLGQILRQQVNNFSLETVGSLLEGIIKDGWHRMKGDSLSMKYINDFYYYIPHETLAYFSLKEVVKSNENLDSYTLKVFESRAINSYGDEVIEILLRFQYLEKELFGMAIKVLFAYGISSELRFHKLLKALVEGLSMNKNSHLYKYNQQIILFDFLYKSVPSNPIFFSKIILFIAPTFLKDNYRSTHSEGNNIVIGNYAVFLGEEQKKFRENLWSFIFKSYKNEALKRATQLCLKEYSGNINYHEKSESILLYDREKLIDFFNMELNHGDFVDNSLIDRYVNKLIWVQIDVEKKILKKLNNRAYLLYQKLTDNLNDKKEYKLSHEEYENFKTRQIRRYIKGFKRSDFMNVLGDIGEIFANKEFLNSNSFRLSRSISRILQIVGNRDFQLFLILYKKIVQSDYSGEIQMNYFHQLRLNKEKVSQFRALLVKDKFIFYLPHLQVSISKRHIIKEDFLHFKKYLKNRKITYFWFLEELLNRFDHFIKDSSKTIGEVLQILFLRAKKEKIYVPNTFFTYIHKKYPKVFNDNFDKIEDLYLRLDDYERHFDYSLEVLKLILERDSDFIIRLFDAYFKDAVYLSKSALLENDYRKLWEMENYEEIFTKILDYSNPFHRISDNPDNIASIFTSDKGKSIKFLKHYLNRTNQENGIFTTFNIVVTLYKEQRMEFLDLILNKGISLDTFKRLDFVVSSMTYSGSIIPRYKYRISELEEYQSHLQAKEDLTLLPHISEIKRRIDVYKGYIESERKREFLTDWGI